MGKWLNFKLLLASMVFMVAIADGRILSASHRNSRSVNSLKAVVAAHGTSATAAGKNAATTGEQNAATTGGQNAAATAGVQHAATAGGQNAAATSAQNAAAAQAIAAPKKDEGYEKYLTFDALKDLMNKAKDKVDEVMSKMSAPAAPAKMAQGMENGERAKREEAVGLLGYILSAFSYITSPFTGE